MSQARAATRAERKRIAKGCSLSELLVLTPKEALGLEVSGQVGGAASFAADRSLACVAALRGLLSEKCPDGGDDCCAAMDAIDAALRRAPRFLEGRRLPSGGWQGSSSLTNGEEHAFMVRCLPVALLALAATGLLGNRLLLLIASLCGACRAVGSGLQICRASIYAAFLCPCACLREEQLTEPSTAWTGPPLWMQRSTLLPACSACTRPASSELRLLHCLPARACRRAPADPRLPGWPCTPACHSSRRDGPHGRAGRSRWPISLLCANCRFQDGVLQRFAR